MTRKAWFLVITRVLVSSILLKGQVFAAGERKKIVMVSNSIAFVALQGKLILDETNLTDINVVHTLSLIYALAIELPLNLTVEQGLAYLQNLLLGISGVQVYDDLVVSVNPIIPALAQEIPSTESYDWGFKHIRFDVGRQGTGLNGQEVKVAIVDTGVGNTVFGGCTHPDLPPYPQLIVDGFNALPGGGSFCDDHGHGTHIAGIIAAEQNDLVIEGAAPQARIVSVKVLDSNGRGHLSDLINGLQWIYNNPQIRLVNMSLGFSTDSPPLWAATKKLSDDNGTIMVASAGNKCSDDGDLSEDGGAEGGAPT